MRGWIIVLLVACSFAGCGEKRVSDELTVKSGWKACYSQAADLDAVSETGTWVVKDVHRLFRLPYGGSKPFKFIWLKTSVAVEQPEGYYGISLGRLYDSDEVYINGTLCGDRRPDDIQEYHFPRNYGIPPGVLKKGENEIHIRLGIFGNEYGGIRGAVKLLSESRFKRQKICDSLLFLHIPLAIISMLFGLMVNALAHYFPKDRESSALAVVGILMVWIVDLTLLFAPFQIFGIGIRTNLLWVSSFVSSILFVIIIQKTFGFQMPRLTRVFVSIEAGFTLWVLVANDPLVYLNSGKITGALNVLITHVMIGILFFRLWNHVDLKMKTLFCFLAVIPGEIIGIDILNYLFGTHTVPYLHAYFIPLIMLLITLFHRWRRLVDIRQLEELALKLKDKDEIHENAGQRSMVTAQVKRKLNRLIDHMEMNYHLPLTRENLAEKAGLSPDYLGRMFKAHSGKKINDYVNDLRIRAACRLLTESQDKIVDIAFAVGFESLATFNRSFMKTMNVSPTEYRQIQTPSIAKSPF